MRWFGAKYEKPLDFKGAWQGLECLQIINDHSAKLLKERDQKGALVNVERVQLATKGKRCACVTVPKQKHDLHSSGEKVEQGIVRMCSVRYKTICLLTLTCDTLLYLRTSLFFFRINNINNILYNNKKYFV